jgi:hypothetical protein
MASWEKYTWVETDNTRPSSLKMLQYECELIDIYGCVSSDNVMQLNLPLTPRYSQLWPLVSKAHII